MNLVSSEAEEGEATAGRRASPLDCFERFVLRTTSFGGRRQSTLKHLPCLTNDSASTGLSAQRLWSPDTLRKREQKPNFGQLLICCSTHDGVARKKFFSFLY